MTNENRVLISAQRYLSRKELIRIDPVTKERFSKPLYTFEQVVYYLYVPVRFLQDSGLLTRKLVDCQRRRKSRPVGRSKSRPFWGVRLGACGSHIASPFQGALAVRPIL